jgi:hypothetical protein
MRRREFMRCSVVRDAVYGGRGKMKKLHLVFAVVATIASAVSAAAQGYPTPKEGD